MRRRAHHCNLHSGAFTLLEALLLVLILGIVSLGFGIAMQSTVRIAPAVDKRLNINLRLVEKLEDLASLTFATLSANSGLSDSVTIGNQSYARTVTVTTFDADGSGAPDADCLEITVSIDGQSLKTRVTQP